MTYRSRLFVICLFGLCFLGGVAGSVRAERVVLAVLAKRGREAALRRWQPLKDYLERRTPYEIELRALPFEELKRAVQRGEVDLVLANPAMFARFEVCCGLSPLLTLKNIKFGRPYTRFGGVIFTRASNGPRFLGDIRGRKVSIGAVNPDSFGGWLAEQREFQKLGLVQGRDYVPRFFGTHDAVVEAVSSGQVEIGCVRTDVLESLAAEGKISLKDFRVLHRQHPRDFDLLVSTPLYPEWPLARAPRLKREVAETVASVLLSLPEESPTAKAMEAAWTIPYNYQSVHDSLRELGAPPYRAYRAKILREARARYFKFILGLTVLTLGAFIVVIYIFLLHRRLSGLYEKLKSYSGQLEGLVEERTQHLVEERERLAVILRSLGEAVLVTERGGKIVLLNPAAERLLGVSAEEVLGQRLCEVIQLEFGPDPDPASDRAVEEKLSPLFFEEATLTLPSGREILVEGSAAPIRSDGEIVGTALILRDITARKRLEAEMQRASKLETLRLVAGGVAHDFNNLLLSIVGYLEVIRLEAEDARLRGFVERAERACFRARTLTRELLSYTTGGGPVKSVVPLGEILRETVSLALSGSVVKASFDLPPDLWPAELDPDQIVICFQNILINARQALPRGGVIHIRARNVVLSADNPYGLSPGPYVELEFEDSGPGIPPENLPFVFEPFFTTKHGGSGLGLFSCRRIVEAHGGFIQAESPPGRGALIRLLLPARPEEALVGPAPEEEAASSAEEIPSARILVMDDEKGVRESMAEILSTYGFEVETAADGEEALKVFRAAREAGRSFDLVILDLTVPGGFGGKELLPRLREIDPDILAIVASGYSSDPVMGQHEDFGFQAALIKPFVSEDLLKAIRKTLRQAKR